MAVAASTLVERVRDIIGDYGEASAALTVEAASDATTLSALDFDGFDAGFAICGYEVVEITAVNTVASPNTLTVRRGLRGTTAATQAVGTVVRYKAQTSGLQILNNLNAAMGMAYPKLYNEVTGTATTVANQQLYDFPTGVEAVVRLEVLDPYDASSDNYRPLNNWDHYDENTIRLYGVVDAGYTLRFIGRAKYTAMTTTGNINADLEELNAQNYLCYMAAALCLYEQQARLGRRDSFVGQSDRFSESAPTVSAQSARELERLAMQFLRRARRRPQEQYLTAAGREYL